MTVLEQIEQSARVRRAAWLMGQAQALNTCETGVSRFGACGHALSEHYNGIGYCLHVDTDNRVCACEGFTNERRAQSTVDAYLKEAESLLT